MQHSHEGGPSPASHTPMRGIRTPQPSRDVCPAAGPDSACKLDFTPGRHHGQDISLDSPPSFRGVVETPKCARSQQRRGRYSIATMLFERECRPTRCVIPRKLLEDFRSVPKSTYDIDNSNSGGSPPFSLQFGRTTRASILAVADEDGYVSLINTSVPKDETVDSHLHAWLCHRNAIFDVAFTEGDDVLATASGDQTIRIWDLKASQPALTMTLRGHVSSVKAVKFRPKSHFEVVSGAREGNIFLWDTRVPSSELGGRFESQPVLKICGAHVRDTSSRQPVSSSRAQNRRNEQPFHHSVTSVVFLDDTVLASAGANDGTVKLWDLRKAFDPSWSQRSSQRGGPVKSFMSRQASATGRPRGISSLALNSTKTKLLASSQDHHLYVFDCIVPEQEPVTFSGHRNNSFYVKSSFSPDDRFIVSGSSDYDVYIWDVSHPLLPPLRLKGHVGEVSDVEWCPTDLCKLASSSDDTTVRIWNIDRSLRDVPHEPEHPADVAFASGRGVAEVPQSWSMPSSQSVDDALVCHETMIESSTSWRSDAAAAAGPPSTPSAPVNLVPQRRPCPPSSGAGGAGRAQSISPSSSPTLRQARLDDIWMPVPRSARPDCNGAGRGDGSMASAGRKRPRAAPREGPAPVELEGDGGAASE